MKYRGIRSDREFNPYERFDSLIAGCLIVLIQLAAYFPSLDTHYRIITGGVVRGTVKELYSDRPFFQLVWIPVQLALNHKAQKLTAAVRFVEERTLQYFLQFIEDDGLRLSALSHRSAGLGLRVFQTWSHFHRPPEGRLRAAICKRVSP
ncbi:MAG TPA: hypothetical protein VHE33_15285 [Acidobacteriaceae bacterium]|nr:hypothetical protein [Acidobacteriaceae bacterium]